MPNTINLISLYSPEMLDEIFVRESVTGILENQAGFPLRPSNVNAKTVFIPEMIMTGLGDYGRNTGYLDGDIEINWLPYTCEMDRGRAFRFDSQDDAETAGGLAGKIIPEYERAHVIPEVDAYRLSKLAGLAKTVVLETISANEIINKLALADEVLENEEVGLEKTILFVSTEVNRLIKQTNELSKRLTQEDYKAGDLSLKIRTFDGRPIVVVPKPRFKSNYVFGTDGFDPVANAADINFMVVHLNAALPFKKHQNIKIITPELNQDRDGWKFLYRIYHDIFTTKNKTAGIYVNRKAKALTVTFVDAHATASGTLATPQAFVEGTALALTQNTGTNSNSGLAFKGWALTQALATAGTVKYLDKASITITENISLYAVWAA